MDPSFVFFFVEIMTAFDFIFKDIDPDKHDIISNERYNIPSNHSND